MALTARQKSFAEEVVKNGGDKVAAYKASGYKINKDPAQTRVRADEVYNNRNVSVMVSELQKEADKIAKQRFTVSIEQRLEWLNEVALAGLEKYEDGNGVKRRENLSATSGAVKILNEMLGVGDDDNNTGERISINFSVSEPVGSVKVTRGG